MFDPSDMIAAIATARGGALRGIVRVSGPDAASCLQRVFEPACPDAASSIPRASAGTLLTAAPIGPIPCDVYFWPTKRSYTRQPCFEVHTIGSPPVLDAALAALCHAGCRLALPGEFTMRAFLAGRLDLTQAEAVLGVIEARDALELSVALKQLAGGLARPLHDLRDQLLDLLARLEAGLDFVEEEIEFVEAAEVNRLLDIAHTRIVQLLEQISNRSQEFGEARIVLRGSPNVGKSSLLNALTNAPAAIVSEQAGTTRDYVGKSMDLFGTMIQIIDTAGVDESPSGIEQAAQAMSDQRSREATFHLLCLDNSRPLNDWEREEIQRSDAIRLIVLTKCDLPSMTEFRGSAIRTSSRDAVGMGELLTAINKALDRARPIGFCIDSTAARCEESLRLAGDSIARGIELVAVRGGDELIASEIRIALHELGRVAGTVYTDDILDRIFSRFCIGK